MNNKKGSTLLYPFRISILLLLTIVMIGIMFFFFVKFLSIYDEGLRDSQMSSDVDHELQTILYSNVDCESLDAKYNGLTFAEVIGFTMKDMEDIYNDGALTKDEYEKEINIKQLDILSCLYNQGGLGLAAYVNDKVMRFYVEYDDIDEGNGNKKLLYTYSTPDGMTYSEAAKDMMFKDCTKDVVIDVLTLNIPMALFNSWTCIDDFTAVDVDMQKAIDDVYITGRWSVITGGIIGGGIVCSRLGGIMSGLVCGEATGITLNEIFPDSTLLFDNEKNDLKGVAKINIPVYPNDQATVYLEMWDKWTEG